MMTPDYVISTYKGCVPHIVDIIQNACFQKHYLVYADDFLHPDGHYVTQSRACSINTFLQIPYPIIIAFRSAKKPTRRARTRILCTHQGSHAITEAIYEQFIRRARPAMYSNFGTSKIDMEIAEPQDVADAWRLLNKGCVISSRFVNEMTNKGFLIELDGEARQVHVTEYGFQCACCAQHGKAYIRHLWSINEIICLNIIQSHNYCHLQKIVESIRYGAGTTRTQ